MFSCLQRALQLKYDMWFAAAACAAQVNLTAKAVPVTKACCACNVQVQWLPAVGPAGENLVRAPEEPRLAAWWRSPCVLGAIDAFAPPARNVARPLRLPVAEVGKGARGGTAVSGKLEAGALRVRRASLARGGEPGWCVRGQAKNAPQH